MKTIEEEVEEEEKRNMLTGLWRTISKMTDISLLWDPIFLLFAVSNLLTSVGFNSPLIFLPKHGTEGLNLDPLTSASVLSVFARNRRTKLGLSHICFCPFCLRCHKHHRPRGLRTRL
uniref:MFS domain-containing protein n=1 Tax=Steinernema glaseri TaxID=37863 RepID=A0A1I8APG6_9BILA